MPPGLFGSSSTQSSSRGSRTAAHFVISALGHAAFFLTVAVITLGGTIDLPVPSKSLVFAAERPLVRLTDKPLPTPQPGGSRHLTVAAPRTPIIEPSAAPAAPVVAPTEISHESGLESLPMLGAVIAIGTPSGGGSGSGSSGAGDGNGMGSGTGDGIGPGDGGRQGTSGPVRLHAGVQAPVKTTHVDPVYPQLARSARVQGTVTLEVVVDASGTVSSVLVQRSVPLLDEAATTAVRRWRYRPALLNGVPTGVIMTVTVHFTLTP